MRVNSKNEAKILVAENFSNGNLATLSRDLRGLETFFSDDFLTRIVHGYLQMVQKEGSRS